jgi:uncharacterized protein YdbL (DUF1318 family)
MALQTAFKAIAGGLLLAGLTLPAPLLAQRDPAYEAARKAGQIGEKPDGYLGVVGGQPSTIQKLADDLNIKRRANYAARAQAANATLEEYAFTQGCILVSRTVAGEKYQAPDGSWQTRTSAPPIRDPRCP